ncbi:hypothetical protein Bca101_060397 [Brassica carinata]
MHKLRHSLSLSLTLIISQIAGRQVDVKIVKNKRALPFGTAQFELEFEKGMWSLTFKRLKTNGIFNWTIAIRENKTILCSYYFFATLLSYKDL